MQTSMISGENPEERPKYAEINFGRRPVDRPAIHPFQHIMPDRRVEERRTEDRGEADRRVGEQRRAQRRRVLLSALVVRRDFGGIFRCGVHDVSDTGARLKIPNGFLLPADFWLIATSSGLAYEAETVWRRYPSVGVAVGEPIDLEDPTNKAARQLRKLWMSVSI